jgi:regulator of replication initiation timing
MRIKRLQNEPLPEEPHKWSGQQVQQVAQNTTYIGQRVLQKLTTTSYKDRTRVVRPKEEWCVFENHHAAIVDDETFETVQRLRSVRRKFSTTGDLGVLNGLIYCADCNDRLRIYNDVGSNYSAYHCRRYAMGKCSRHSINRALLEKMVLDEIQRVTAMVRNNKDKFKNSIRSEKDKATAKRLKSQTEKLAKADKRIAELDSIINRLFENNVAGTLSTERFTKMLATYESEQTSLVAEAEELRKDVEAVKEQTDNIERFFALAAKYTDLKELTAEIARTFVEKIVVHEAIKVPGHKWKKLSQDVDIYITLIGAVPKE